jgi:hypothetical protein
MDDTSKIFKFGSVVQWPGWPGTEISCVAAFRVKPKARLCESWVMVRSIRRPTVFKQGPAYHRNRCRPFGLYYLGGGGDPRLAKPNLGLNSDHCYAAR